MKIKSIHCVFIALIILLIAACGQQRESEKEAATSIVFKHGKIAGDPKLFNKLLTRFEEENPGIVIRNEALPASTDEQHQYYVINLEGEATDFDVLSLDVIWVQEFARAGWLADISQLIPPEDRGEFFPGPLQAVTYKGNIYAIPWYIDAGLLYYRQDLLQKYGFSPPKTWNELIPMLIPKTVNSKRYQHLFLSISYRNTLLSG